MKTIQDLKEEYAKSVGQENWHEFKQNYHPGEVENALESIIENLLIKGR